MTEPKSDPKIEALRVTAREFMNQEKQSLTDFSQRVLQEVETLVESTVKEATDKVSSMLKKIETVVRTEPLVAFTALAITGIAVANIIRKRRSPIESAATPSVPEQTFH